jgi:hypothetical protein
MTELQAARSSVVASHKRMDKIREALGLRTTAQLSGKTLVVDEELEVTAEAARRRA